MIIQQKIILCNIMLKLLKIRQKNLIKATEHLLKNYMRDLNLPKF
jgi:hypothetical protein